MTTTPQTRHNLPNIHDPARKPTPQAAQRAEQKQSYIGKTPEQIIRETPQKKLETYARRGAPLAIAEKARRAVMALGIILDSDLDLGV